METLHYIVQEEHVGLRLDILVANQYTEFSRNQVKKMLNEEQIFVNKVIEKPSYIVKLGDHIMTKLKDPVILDVLPEDIKLDVYYEDEDVIVVNKPSGMVVHPAVGHFTGTMVNAVLHHCDDLSGINGVLRPGIVHRIDKDTSGLIIMAKNDLAHISLADQFKAKTTMRVYYAICHGNIKQDHGTIHAPINRDPKDRKRMAVQEGGRDAVTHFEVLERFGDYTFIKCILETGRTHQIRVHMSYIKYPLVGDDKYGPKKVYGKYGQFLHAAKLGFIHPRTKEFLSFEAPLPDFFERFLSQLRNKQTH